MTTRYTTRHALCGPKMCSTAASPVDQAAHDMSTCRICYPACPFRPKLCCVAASPSSTLLPVLPHSPFLTALCGTPGTQQPCYIAFAAHALPLEPRCRLHQAAFPVLLGHTGLMRIEDRLGDQVRLPGVRALNAPLDEPVAQHPLLRSYAELGS